MLQQGVSCLLPALQFDGRLFSGSPCAQPLFLSLGLSTPLAPPVPNPLNEERVIAGGPLDVIMSSVRCPEPLPRNLTNQELHALCKYEWFMSEMAKSMQFAEWVTDPRRMIDEEGQILIVFLCSMLGLLWWVGRISQRALIQAILESPFLHHLSLPMRTTIIKRFDHMYITSND